MKQVLTFSIVLDVGGAIRLPKYALYERQPATTTQPARFLYVLDVRTCQRETFKVYAYVPTTQAAYAFTVNTKTSAIACRFADYAKSAQIHAPIWPIYHRDNIGQPRDRKPQKYNTKYGYIRGERRCEERYVTDGAIVGTFRHTDESYSHVRLGMDAISFNRHTSADFDIDSLELPALV